MLNNYTFNSVTYNGRLLIDRKGLFPNMILNFVSKAASFSFDLRNFINKVGIYGFDLRNFISKVVSFPFDIRSYISKVGLFSFRLEGIKNAVNAVFNEFKVKFRVFER
jgi:hypothetical protein